jgi:hypothetical protein
MKRLINISRISALFVSGLLLNNGPFFQKLMWIARLLVSIILLLKAQGSNTDLSGSWIKIALAYLLLYSLETPKEETGKKKSAGKYVVFFKN